MIEICCGDRWQAYRRFLELGIDCQCKGYCPLLARIDGPNQAIQVWSTTQWISQEHGALKQRLERCWRLDCTAAHTTEARHP